MEQDKLEKIKELLTRCIEIDDQLSTLKDERKTLIKKYVKDYQLDMKVIEMAVKAIKNEIDLKNLESVMDAIEPIVK